MIIKSGEQVPIYFAASYTKPLRDQLNAGSDSMGSPALGGMDR